MWAKIKYSILVLFLGCAAYAQPTGMAVVKGGAYLPLYGTVKNENVTVRPFLMDITPVTHAQFLEFVMQNPQWQKSGVKRLFADANYLKNWGEGLQVPGHLRQSPVNNISWYAAKAYCECQGKRLPSVDEWEFAAMADETRPDARADSLYNQLIISGYEKPKTHLNKVGESKANYYGIYDLHGMVWEWTYDFNSIIITGESRNNNNTNKGLFCASGAVGANDLMNYAAFMRYATRSSVKADFTMTNMGFRCAKDIETTN